MPRIVFNPYTSLYLEVIREDTTPKENVTPPNASTFNVVTGSSGVTRLRRQTLPNQDLGVNHIRTNSLPQNILDPSDTSSKDDLPSRYTEVDDADLNTLQFSRGRDTDVSLAAYAESIMYAPSTIYAESVAYNDERTELLSGEIARTDLHPRVNAVPNANEALQDRPAQNQQPLFGSLEHAVNSAGIMVQIGEDEVIVPGFVHECIQFLLNQAPTQEYTPSSSTRVLTLRKTLIHNPHAPINFTLYNPQDIASFLSSYFFTLPNPIIPFAFYASFRHYALSSSQSTSKSAILSHYQNLLLLLPKAHRDLLLYFLDFYGTLHAQARLDYCNCLMFRFTPAMVRERPRAVRDTRRQMLFLPKHNHLPTVLFLVRVRGAFTTEALEDVVPIQGLERDVLVAERRADGGGNGFFDKLRGSRRVGGRRGPVGEALVPVGASR